MPVSWLVGIQPEAGVNPAEAGRTKVYTVQIVISE